MSFLTRQLSKGTDIDFLFLYGWGMNQGFFQAFSQLFRERYSANITVRCLDLPGYGKAHNTQFDDYSLENVSQWFAHKLCKPSVVIGWSMGGLIAQYLASNQNEHLLAHIQIASTPCFVEDGDWPGIKPSVMSIFARQLKMDHESLLRRFLTLQSTGLEKPKSSVNTMLALLTQYPSNSLVALEQSLALLHSTDLRQQLSQSKLPCLRIYGGLDGLVPTKVAEKINTVCTSSDFVIIDKASHAPFLSHPEDTFNAIAGFLKTSIGLSRSDIS